jgi:hypothetical protein
MRPAVFFRLRLRLRLQNTAELLTLILSPNLVQNLGGSQFLAELDPLPTVRVLRLPDLKESEDLVDFFLARRDDGKDFDEIGILVNKLADEAEELRLDQLTTGLKGGNDGNPYPPEFVPFRTHILPSPLFEFVDEASASLSCDPTYIVLPLIATLAAAVGNARRIKLKSSWSEPCIFWTVTIGESGTMKSPAWQLAVQFLEDRQAKAFSESRDLQKRYEIQKKLYDADLRQWQKTGRANGEPPPEEPDEVESARFICSDTTVEAIGALLADHPRGLLLARDELSGWVNSFDAYKGGRGADVAHWLSMHRAGSITFDRKTGRRVIHVPSANVSIAGTVQPETFKAALKGRSADGDEKSKPPEHFANGLGPRLLLAHPPRIRKHGPTLS